MDLIREYWWLIVIVVALALVAVILLRPRQRVTADRQRAGPAAHGQPPHAKAAGWPARPRRRPATSPASCSARRSTASSMATSEPGDDFCRIKGVGPKFADALHALGFTRFEQLAHLTPTEIERLDAQLGAFSGRIDARPDRRAGRLSRARRHRRLTSRGSASSSRPLRPRRCRRFAPRAARRSACRSCGRPCRRSRTTSRRGGMSRRSRADA